MAHEYLFHFIFDYSIFNICGKNDILFSIYFQLNIFLLKKYFILTQKNPVKQSNAISAIVLISF